MTKYIVGSLDTSAYVVFPIADSHAQAFITNKWDDATQLDSATAAMLRIAFLDAVQPFCALNLVPIPVSNGTSDMQFDLFPERLL